MYSIRMIALATVALMSAACGGGFEAAPPTPHDDAGAPGEDAPATPEASVPEAGSPEASSEAGDDAGEVDAGDAGACLANGAQCFFDDAGAGVGCCAGTYCQSHALAAPPTCQPALPICLTAGTPCDSDGGGYACCSGLTCRSIIGTAPDFRCLADDAG